MQGANNKLKIIVISRGWWPHIHGGAEKFIFNVVKELAKKHNVTVLTSIGPSETNREYTVYSMKLRRLSTLNSIKFSIWASRKAANIPADAILVNNYWGEIAPLFLRNKPIITIIHDVGFISRKSLMSYIKKLLLKSIIRNSKKVIVPSESVLKDLTSITNIVREKVLVLGFEGVEGPFKKTLIENNYFDILLPGRFAPNKGHDIALEAFRYIIREIPNARLWFVGGLSPGYEEYFKKIKELASEFGDKVIIKVDVEDMDPYYRLADLCIFPSKGEEGYGLTVLEAMTYGKPIVASKIFELTGVVSRDKALIVEPENPRALANAIISIYKGEINVESMIEKALEQARKLSWNRVAEILEQVIYSVIEETNNRKNKV